VASPKVSVLIPTYQQVEFVEETMASAIEQTYDNLEIVVSDDGSQDGTAELVEACAKRHPDRVIAITSEHNTGLAGNFNRLLGAHQGDLIAWLGGDDLMHPAKIERQVELMAARPDAAGCCHDAEVFESPSGRVLGRFSELYNGRRGFVEGGAELWFRVDHLVLPSSLMVRSSALPARGYSPLLRYMNEWIFDVETFRSGPIVPLDDVLGRYRRHAGNVTDTAAMRDALLEEGLMAVAMATARWPEFAHLARKRRAGLLMARALADARAGQCARAGSYLRAAAVDGGPAAMASAVAAQARVRAGRFRHRRGSPR
jgi:glycosyltransferase involved in cell wall biosynthesis